MDRGAPHRGRHPRGVAPGARQRVRQLGRPALHRRERAHPLVRLAIDPLDARDPGWLLDAGDVAHARARLPPGSARCAHPPRDEPRVPRPEHARGLLRLARDPASRGDGVALHARVADTTARDRGCDALCAPLRCPSLARGDRGLDRRAQGRRLRALLSPEPPGLPPVRLLAGAKARVARRRLPLLRVGPSREADGDHAAPPVPDPRLVAARPAPRKSRPHAWREGAVLRRRGGLRLDHRARPDGRAGRHQRRRGAAGVPGDERMPLDRLLPLEDARPRFARAVLPDRSPGEERVDATPRRRSAPGPARLDRLLPVGRRQARLPVGGLARLPRHPRSRAGNRAGREPGRGGPLYLLRQPEPVPPLRRGGGGARVSHGGRRALLRIRAVERRRPVRRAGRGVRVSHRRPDRDLEGFDHSLGARDTRVSRHLADRAHEPRERLSPGRTRRRGAPRVRSGARGHTPACGPPRRKGHGATRQGADRRGDRRARESHRAQSTVREDVPALVARLRPKGPGR